LRLLPSHSSLGRISGDFESKQTGFFRHGGLCLVKAVTGSGVLVRQVSGNAGVARAAHFFIWQHVTVGPHLVQGSI
jgi:hypothetical protein